MIFLLWLEERNKMKKYIKNLTGFSNLLGLIALVVLLFPPGLKANTLSNRAKITVLTCGPAKPMYATFGHTAIRVSDPENHIDEVYNFGTFDPGIPNFYLQFIGGRLKYSLSVTSFRTFLSEYKSEGRWVKSQDLLLSNEKLNMLHDSLQQAYLPENRHYRYGFFKNNCSTKIMNMIVENSGNSSAIDTLNMPSGLTYRKALKHYLKNRPWLQFGINLLLGPFSDQKISRKQSCFMPDLLMNEIENAGLATSPKVVLDGTYIDEKPNELNTPMVILWFVLLLLVVKTFWLKTSRQVSNSTDLFLFISAALLGLLYLILWNWSAHVSLHYNFNIIWANPLLLVLLWSIPARKTKFNRVFLFLYALLLFFFLINFSRLPQKIPLEAMPLTSMLVLIAVNRVFQFRKTASKIY